MRSVVRPCRYGARDYQAHAVLLTFWPGWLDWAVWLVWLAWIIGRPGGWNCYYKPPGPKTMRAGWTQFAAMAVGFVIAAA